MATGATLPRSRTLSRPFALVMSWAVLVACSGSSSSSSSSVRSVTTTSAALSTAPIDAAATTCESVAPASYTKYFASESVTVAEIRAVVVGTLPASPTSLVLPDHEPSDTATMCWATDGAGRYVQYWVTPDGQTKTLCTTSAPETLQPDQVGTIRCF